MRLRHSRAASLIAVAILVAGSSARALDVGPKSIPLKVGGVAVDIPVVGQLDVRTNADNLALAASATGDLQAIQANALPIAQGLKLPSDACKRKGVNLVVNHIDAASLTPMKASVLIDLSGHVTVWACAKVMGVALKTKLAEDEVRITAPVELYLPNSRAVALRLSGLATLATSNPKTREAASVLVGDIDAALSELLSKLLDTTRARAAAPLIPGLDVDIESAVFAQDGDKLLVKATGRANVSSDAFTTLMGYLGK